ncbi:hypothetical protein KSS87_018269 [Heliosperma pusillum]|nr:hypothetical protein KSS87_018269 [Heliosperma pusillum]
MAFLNKVGNILKQSASKQIGSQFLASNPSIYQALRCMSSSKVFIGGLPWAMDDTNLRETFSQYGEVLDARVIVDREQNRSKGFGFVTFSSTEAASSAIQAMDGQDLQGRRVKVDYAADRAPRSFGGGGGGFGGGSYSGGGFGGGGGGYGGGGGGNYSGGQNYGGGSGGGYSNSNGGGNSGAYDGGNSGGYSGGYGSGSASHGVAAGGSFYGGGATGGNVTADSGFASSGFEGGPGFSSNSSGDFNPTGVPESSFGDDLHNDDFAKRA